MNGPKSTKKNKKSKKPQKPRKSPRKGALIKGMSKRLPAEILRDAAFKIGLDEIMRGYSGIYALYKKKTLYYVGLTKNLKRRIKTHLKDRHKNKWDSFVIFRIQRVEYLKDIETLLTRIVEPKGNRVKGKVPSDANLNRVLNRIRKERQLSLSRIEKALK